MKKLIQTLCLTFFAAILVAYGEEKLENPGDIVKAMITESITGDANKALEYMDLEYISKQTGEPIDRLRQYFLDSINKDRNKDEYSSGIDVSIDETLIPHNNGELNTATVRFTVISKKNGNKEEDSLNLIKTEKGWKVRPNI